MSAVRVRLVQNLAVALVALLGALLLAEGAIRALRLVPVNDYRRLVEPGVAWRMRPHASMLDDQPEFKVPIAINAAGYRDREFAMAKPAGRVRIALIGDSFTFGTGVTAEARTSNRLEARLRAAGLDVEAFNFGLAGLDTWGATDVLTRGAARLHPDWAVLMVYLGNDVTDNLRRVTRDTTAAASRAPSPSWRSSVARWIAARSRLYQFVMIRVASVPALRALFNRLKAANLAGEVVDQLEILDVRHAPDGALWRPTRDALARFVTEASRAGARPLVVLLPSRLQYDDAVWDRLAASRRLDPAIHDRLRPNRLLAAWVADSLRATVLDPTAAFRALGTAAGTTYFPINGHFTERGHEVVAAEMARSLEPAVRAIAR
jgi:lysophospholipase L1-like esterase